MLRFAHHYQHHDAWLGISTLLLLGAKSEEKQTPPSLGPGFHLQFWVLPAEGRALTSPPPPPAHPIPVFKSGECSFCLSSFRCLQEDPEIWDIPWKLCSPSVSGLRGNSEPTQDGVGNRALMGGREDPPTHTPLPQDLSCWHLQTSPAVVSTEPPMKPPGLIPTHNSQAFL